MNRYLLCGVFLFASKAFADDVPKPEQFAFNRNIEISGDSGFNVFDVPEEIYRNVTKANLEDTRVFNGDGAIVRSEVSIPESVSTTSVEDIELPLFPIQGSDSDKGTGSKVEISESKTGDIISVRFEGSKSDNIKNPRTEYLSDLRKLNNSVGKFEIKWKGGDGRIVPVEVSSSEDLKSWRSYCSGVLAKLEYQGYQVNENTLDCPNTTGKFIRFSFPKDNDLSIESVKTRSHKVDTMLPKESSIQIVPSDTEQDGTVFMYDSKGMFPVHEFVIHLSDRNALVDISVSSRASLDKSFVERGRFKAYNLIIDGMPIQNGTKLLNTLVPDRYWKVETKDKEIKLSSPPKLELRWRPHRVYFLTHGSVPFNFAYGSALISKVSQGSNDVTSLMKASNITPDTAKLGAEEESGGVSLLTKKPSRPADWRKWALWGVLFVVLGIVLMMALKLSRELKQ